MMRILLTGASGLLGSDLGNLLYEFGYDVLGVVYRHKSKGNFPTVTLDLSNEWEIKEHFDIIVHTAGSLPYTQCTLSEYYRNNVLTMDKLVNFARKRNIKRVINISTNGIYGEFRCEQIYEDSDIINPNGYGLTKYLAECMLRDATDITSISLRPPRIIGKGCRGIWFSNTVEKFKANKPVKIYAPNFKTKNFVWVRDLSNFIIKLIHSEIWKYDTLNVACSEAATTMEIVSTMKELLRSKSEIVVDNTIRQPFCLNSDKAVEMGYKSLSPLDIVREFCRL